MLKKHWNPNIIKMMLILGTIMVLTACVPMNPFDMTGKGNMMERMMDQMRGEGQEKEDHQSHASHAYLPMSPLEPHAFDPDSVYYPGSVNELTGELAEDGVREFRVTAAPKPIEIRDGLVVKSWAYNDSVPGPLLRMKEGERVRIIFENNVPDIKTAIHWHGLLVPNNMDGVPPITQPYVDFGESFVYEFEAKPSGTFWYHAHSMGDGAQQLDQGLKAPLIIEPQDNGWIPETDHEWVVILDEWQIKGAGPAPTPVDGGMMSRGMMNEGIMNRGMMGDMMNGGMMNSGMMNSHLLGTANGYNMFTINGRAHLEEPFVAETGELIRLRLFNGGFQQHRIHVHGLNALVTHTDGHLLPKAQPMEELIISPFERLDVLLYGTETGEYILHNHNPGHSEAGMQARIQLIESIDNYTKSVNLVNDLPISESMSNAPRYQNIKAGVPGVDFTDYERKYNLTIGMSMGAGMGMANSQWTINGKSFHEADPLPIREGEKIRVTLFNMSPESHPMHLHGHEFKIVELNGRTLSEPWVTKDTLNILPMESITIAFEANNGPGDWLFHCHQSHHADDGLKTQFRYVD